MDGKDDEEDDDDEDDDEILPRVSLRSRGLRPNAPKVLLCDIPINSEWPPILLF